MKNKDMIVKTLKEAMIGGSSKKNYTTQEIADILSIQRANASTLLNQLVKEGTIQKVKTWPVSYQLSEKEIDTAENDVFGEIIGTTDSLKNVIELMKAAVFYPNKCLNTIISGESGTGKNMFAYKMYELALAYSIIQKDKEFVYFNCLNYINDKDDLKENFIKCFQKADGTFFHIDNADYLDSTPKNILLDFLEKGFLNIDGKNICYNTTIIISTKGNISDDFKGKIPIIITLPDFSEWSMQDRFLLIKDFITKESQKSGKEIVVGSEIIIALLLCHYSNNIQQLKNEIIQACAIAYVKNQYSNQNQINLFLSDFSNHIRSGFLEYESQKASISNVIKLNKKYIFKADGYTVNENSNKTENIYDVINKKTEELRNSGISEEDIGAIISIDIENEFRKYHNIEIPETINYDQLYNLTNENIVHLTENLINKASKELKRNYPNSLFYGLCMHLDALVKGRTKNQNFNKDRIVRFISDNKSEYSIAYDFSLQFSKEMNVKLSIDEIVLIAMFLCEYNNGDLDENRPAVLLAMHGNSAASSIADVCRSLNGTLVYSFDLPLSKKPLDAYEDLKKIILKIPSTKGILAIVDSGSLKELLNMVIDETGRMIKIIEIPFTTFILDCCRKTIVENDLDIIYNQALASMNQFSIFNQHNIQKGGKAIISVCLTGEGSAIEIKRYLEKKFDLGNIQVIPLQIAEKGKLLEKVNDISKEIKVICIVGTYDPQIYGIPFVSIDKIYTNNGHEIKNIINKEMRDVSYFTAIVNEIFDSLSSNITHTNIVDDKEAIIKLVNNIDEDNHCFLPNDSKAGLLIHIICAFDRMISKESISPNVFTKELIDNNRKIYLNLKKEFKYFEKKYNITVNDDEISYIIQMLTEKRI